MCEKENLIDFINITEDELVELISEYENTKERPGQDY